MAEARKDSAEAIIHYLQVDSGNDFLSATLSLLDIFVRQEDFLSAQQHMNRVRLRFRLRRGREDPASRPAASPFSDGVVGCSSLGVPTSMG